MRLTNAIRNWKRRKQADAELDEEVRGYAEMLAEEKFAAAQIRKKRGERPIWSWAAWSK